MPKINAIDALEIVTTIHVEYNVDYKSWLLVLKDYQSSQPKNIGQWTNQVQKILLHLKILDPINSHLQPLFYFESMVLLSEYE